MNAKTYCPVCGFESGCGGTHVPHKTGSTPRPLPPLPQYTCRTCKQTFGSNCDPEDIMCAWCEAQRCPHCHAWFGGEEGVVSPDPRQVSVSREDLRALLADNELTTEAAQIAYGRLSAAVEVK